MLWATVENEMIPGTPGNDEIRVEERSDEKGSRIAPATSWHVIDVNV